MGKGEKYGDRRDISVGKGNLEHPAQHTWKGLGGNKGGGLKGGNFLMGLEKIRGQAQGGGGVF